MVNSAGSGLKVDRSQSATYRPSPEFVRLSQLRKLLDCQQVAAVCFRAHRGDIEFLLVQTRGSGRWTFPKGGAEPGLTHAQAAALEAFEEAGVHGRIEEASFARYRRKRDDSRDSPVGSRNKELAVNAHLCEVLRLSPVRESNRNRTWFSPKEARQRLREGRGKTEGAEFARVVDRAVARIERLHGSQPGFPECNLRQDVPQKDPLHQVQFEALPEASWAPYLRRQVADSRRSAVAFIDTHPRELLECEVLQFDSPREKKVKALGTGAKNG